MSCIVLNAYPAINKWRSSIFALLQKTRTEPSLNDNKSYYLQLFFLQHLFLKPLCGGWVKLTLFIFLLKEKMHKN